MSGGLLSPPQWNSAYPRCEKNMFTTKLKFKKRTFSGTFLQGTPKTLFYTWSGVPLIHIFVYTKGQGIFGKRFFLHPSLTVCTLFVFARNACDDTSISCDIDWSVLSVIEGRQLNPWLLRYHRAGPTHQPSNRSLTSLPYQNFSSITVLAQLPIPLAVLLLNSTD